jgi:hypothetical protein
MLADHLRIEQLCSPSVALLGTISDNLPSKVVDPDVSFVGKSGCELDRRTCDSSSVSQTAAFVKQSFFGS